MLCRHCSIVLQHSIAELFYDFHEFCDFSAIRESFLHEMLLSYRSAKVFSFENFPLYGTN